MGKSFLGGGASLYSGVVAGVVVNYFCRVRLFATPWTAVRLQASLSITISQSLLKVMSIELVMPSNHLSSASPAVNLS